MRPTEDLFRLIEDEGIILRYYELPGGRVGLYVHLENLKYPHIFIDPSIIRNEVEFRAVLAHELGHHFTLGGLHAIKCQGEYLMKSIWERRADRWAIDYMVRESDVLKLYRKGYEVWEMAEKLIVPEIWVKDKVGRMKNRGRFPE